MSGKMSVWAAAEAVRAAERPADPDPVPPPTDAQPQPPADEAPTKVAQVEAERDALALELSEVREEAELKDRRIQHLESQGSEFDQQKMSGYNELEQQVRTLKSSNNQLQAEVGELRARNKKLQAKIEQLESTRCPNTAQEGANCSVSVARLATAEPAGSGFDDILDV